MCVCVFFIVKLTICMIVSVANNEIIEKINIIKIILFFPILR